MKEPLPWSLALVALALVARLAASRPSRAAPRRARQARRWSTCSRPSTIARRTTATGAPSAYIEQKEKDKVDVVYETEYYRRSRTRSS